MPVPLSLCFPIIGLQDSAADNNHIGSISQNNFPRTAVLLSKTIASHLARTSWRKFHPRSQRQEVIAWF
jgi:hypothetical protein